MTIQKKVFDINLWLLTIGLSLIVFASIILFTRPALWDLFDLSQTGQIGDTIGGISAPIINLIGAILIYISFKAQVKANKNQNHQFNIGLENQEFDRNFQTILELFNSLKSDFKDLSHEGYKGKAALNVFINDIRDYWNKDDFLSHRKFPIYTDWKFLLAEYDLISFHLESSNFRDKEKQKLISLVKNYYFTQLEQQSISLKKRLVQFDLDDDVLKIISDIEEFNTQEKTVANTV